MTSSQDSLASECRFEKALRLAEANLAKRARQPAYNLEVQLHCQALQAKQEAKEKTRQEWLESLTLEKLAESQDRTKNSHARHEQVQNFNKSKQEGLLATAAAKTQASEARAEMIAQRRAEEEAANREIATAREQRILNTTARANELLQEKVAAARREQERLQKRRSMVDMENAKERAASCERRRARQDTMNEHLRAHSQHLEGERRNKEQRFLQKCEQAEAEHRRRGEIMERIRQLQHQNQQKVAHIKELTWKASVTNNEDILRQELEVLVPRLSSAPTTPRGSFCSSKGMSPGSVTNRIHSDRFIPATFQPTTPRRGKPQTPRPGLGQFEAVSPFSAFSASSPTSSRSSVAVVSPHRQKARFDPVNSAVSLGSTRASIPEVA
mmetsp:Transcript_52119/g.63834  ORF Transcript_52119/g.63834 Transcript_52119/m.63834 type:complete len:384 (-) Transcript_52119:59-1210(-)